MATGRATEIFVASGRNLEDSFFLDQDRELLAYRTQLTRLAETKEALASVSGIKSQEVLQHLVEMNVRPETLAAVSVIPLIEVAWADGNVAEGEKKVILQFAASQGVAAGGIGYDLLQRWLEHRPSDRLLETWQHYVEALCEKLSPSDRQALKDEIMHHARAAASASGGLFGLGKVSGAEKAVLAKLEGSFGC